MIKIQKQICECCGGSSFKNIGKNRIQCEYCDTVYITDEDYSERKIGFEMNPNDYCDRFRDEIERINKECEELGNGVTLIEQYDDVYLDEKQREDKYNDCILLEVKRKKKNKIFTILLILCLVLSGVTNGISSFGIIFFLFMIVYNDSKKSTRESQQYIKDYLMEAHW